MRIGINCGHTVSGTVGCGAVGRIDESVETRRVGNKLSLLLSKAGHTVFDCTDDYASSVNANLNEIVKMANAQPLDLFISIHFNSGGGRGVEVFTYGGKSFTEAVNVCTNISALGFRNRGIKDGSKLAVVRRSNAKAMLIEVCFVDTDDADTYKRLGADKIAEAICKAITPNIITEYTEINDIIWELNYRGIISDSGMWVQRCEKDKNIYWFCRKLCHYIRTKQRGETADRAYTDIHDIVWDLNFRGVLSETKFWEKYCKKDTNVYHLLRKGLHYCRTY